MSVFRRISTVGRRKPSVPLLAVAMLAGYMAISPVHSATFGHSRLVSAVGEPLRITIPVTQLSAAEAESLRIVPAPASEWLNAGLTPPVDPATLQIRLIDGYATGTRVIQVWSDQAFNQPIADLLLDIHTASGVQRYQVSLLARGGAAAVQAPSAMTAAGSPSRVVATQTDTIRQAPVLIRRGDTMFSVAQRHAVTGVTVYQMMIALQRANPHAFIHQNVNLIKAGERLAMPDMDALTALSDREARRLFHEQVVAFNAYRQGQGDLIAAGASTEHDVMPTVQEPASANGVSNIPDSRAGGGDQLKLSSGRSPLASTSGSSVDDAAQGARPGDVDTVSADTTPGSENSLVQNMASGVSQTAHAATATDAANATLGADAGSSSASQAGASLDTAMSITKAAQPPGDASSPTQNGQQLSGDGSQSDDAVAARKAIEDAEARVSMLEENVKNLNRALQSQGEAAIDVVVDGAIGLRQSLTDVATAVTDATIGDDDFLDDPASEQQGTEATRKPINKETGMMETIATWVHANFIWVVTGVLALIVLVIAWVLRRANSMQSRSENAITPEMVKEKLNEINLDLQEPSVGDSARRS